MQLALRTNLKKAFRALSNQKVANFGIYASMIQYVFLWIYPDLQAKILLLGMIFWALRIPYFVKIRETAIVSESVFLICADLLGVFLNLESSEKAARECLAIFGI